ncbi:MAG: hypothetical protein WA087_00955 [Candidatus Saccharimonadales bacterium]
MVNQNHYIFIPIESEKMLIKNIVLIIASVVVVGGGGYAVYNASVAGNNKTQNNTESTTDEKITGTQAEGENVEVYSALLQASPANFATDDKNVVSGYRAPAQVTLHSGKKMAKVAIEELHVNNLNAVGDCNVSDKKASVGTYTSGVQQAGYASFDMTCRTGVNYTVESILETVGTYDSSKLLSYGGLTPASLTRSISFDIAVKFDDGTMTKKTFKGNISGATLSNGDFGAGSIGGDGEMF